MVVSLWFSTLFVGPRVVRCDCGCVLWSCAVVVCCKSNFVCLCGCVSWLCVCGCVLWLCAVVVCCECAFVVVIACCVFVVGLWLCLYCVLGFVVVFALDMW